MKIRLAKNEDAAELACLRRETILSVNSKDYPEEIIQDWIVQRNTQNFVENISKYKRWVAIERNKIIGFCDHNFECEISRIYVHKDHLRKGIGSRLLQVAEESLKKHGCKEINIEATITAKEFYEKHGYKVLEKAVHKTQNIEAIVYKMIKSLSAISEY